MKHNDLCFELAKAKSTIFINAPLGSVWANLYRNDFKFIDGKWQKIEKYPTTKIADVVRIIPSYTKFCIDIFECKVQRSDYLKDLKSKKYINYLGHCNRLYFVIEKGISDLKEFEQYETEDIGLIIYGDKGFYTRKQAKIREIEYPLETLMALLFYRQKYKFRKFKNQYIGI